ncbi:MAG: acetyl-CoA C-acetyltransferase [Spirochaetes bacterium]|nr:acetyl-CoA C-acetyltransferase [Spirochaetota bacterium]
MKKIYIVGAKRTAIGAFGGSFVNVSAPMLCAKTIEAGLEQANLKPGDTDEVIVGNILQAGQGMGPGRQAAIYANIPAEKCGYSVNILCGSGMKSVMLGAQAIKAEDSQIVVASGMENMSQAPYLLPYQSRFGSKLGHFQVMDHMINDGLTDVFNQYHMGITAENIVKKHKISREAQDEFAYNSQMKAKEAIEAGKFKDEIIPVSVKIKRKEALIEQDEHPRFDTTIESLAGLRPAFDKEGSVTAGNASGINDGASTILLASEDEVNKKGLKPLAELIGYSQAGVDPAYMGLGPVPAIIQLLEKTGVDQSKIDLFELNEAFAAQSLGVVRELSEHFKISENDLLNRCNVNGGAIALGHPIGASGNRIIVTLLYEMKKRQSQYGVAALCIGGGMGTSVLLKNCN